MTTIMKSAWNEDAKAGGNVYTRSRKALEGPEIRLERTHMQIWSQSRGYTQLKRAFVQAADRYM